ncbi:hypothetical protein VTI74DRAFT_4217 [Chaetomium olivicolor]
MGTRRQVWCVLRNAISLRRSKLAPTSVPNRGGNRSFGFFHEVRPIARMSFYLSLGLGPDNRPLPKVGRSSFFELPDGPDPGSDRGLSRSGRTKPIAKPTHAANPPRHVTTSQRHDCNSQHQLKAVSASLLAPETARIGPTVFILCGHVFLRPGGYTSIWTRASACSHGSIDCIMLDPRLGSAILDDRVLVRCS